MANESKIFTIRTNMTNLKIIKKKPSQDFSGGNEEPEILKIRDLGGKNSLSFALQYWGELKQDLSFNIAISDAKSPFLANHAKTGIKG